MKQVYEAPTDAGVPAAGPLAAVVKRTKPAKKKKKKKPAKVRPKPAKKKKKKKPAKVVKRKSAPKKVKAVNRSIAVARPARLDLRLTKAEKAKLIARAKKLRRTVTSVVLEMIEKLK